MGGQSLAIMNKISKGEHSPPTAKNPRVPRWLERAVERCLKVSPADRLQSASALIEALTDGLRGDGLGDFDGELQAYLRELPVYNERFPARIIESSLSQLRQSGRTAAGGHARCRRPRASWPGIPATPLKRCIGRGQVRAAVEKAAGAAGRRAPAWS